MTNTGNTGFFKADGASPVKRGGRTQGGIGLSMTRVPQMPDDEAVSPDVAAQMLKDMGLDSEDSQQVLTQINMRETAAGRMAYRRDDIVAGGRVVVGLRGSDG